MIAVMSNSSGGRRAAGPPNGMTNKLPGGIQVLDETLESFDIPETWLTTKTQSPQRR
ncbi:MAG: hypothetical protein WBN65_03215 [Gammaproteobacteria bacterium]